ncbi:MAG: ABC-2 transporter permease, partial [Clostridia bacterium]|nr:ABC-2 transporter permease [Clostridia bacterium]
MTAVFKREFKSYFSTPIGYIVVAAYFFFLGLYFTFYYSGGSPDIASLISGMSTIAIFTVPILTMRLMSEDRRQKVDQALLTAPVSLTGIVMGKFLAALAVYAIGFAPTVIFEIIIMSYVTVNIMSYIYALIGIILLGG